MTPLLKLVKPRGSPRLTTKNSLSLSFTPLTLLGVFPLYASEPSRVHRPFNDQPSRVSGRGRRRGGVGVRGRGERPKQCGKEVRGTQDESRGENEGKGCKHCVSQGNDSMRKKFECTACVLLRWRTRTRVNIRSRYATSYRYKI